MKNRIIFIFLAVSFSFFVNYSHSLAQFPNLKFEYLSVDEGLSNNRVKCILRDSRGFLWVGTEMGLNKYDGVNLKIYENIESDLNSISGNDILCIFEDQQLRLWIGTTQGLNLFDRDTETFIKFPHNILDTTTISDDNITSIIEDKNADLWVSTRNGFNKWVTKENRFIRYLIPGNENYSLNNYINNICFDNSENIWIASRGDKIWKYNPVTSLFESFTDPKFSSLINIDKTIVTDLSGILWIGTRGGGLISFNQITKQFTFFNYNGKNNGTSGKDITQLFPDRNGYLWITVDHGGINRLDLKNYSMEYCMQDEKKVNGLNNDGLWSIYLDNEGILYAGTSSGGLNISNPKKSRFELYRNNPIDKNSLIYNVIFRFFEDSKGTIWIGTDGGGLSAFNPKNKTFKNYKYNSSDQKGGISSNTILCIDEDKNHDIWFGTWGEGLNKYERKTGKFYQYLHNPFDLRSIASNNVWELISDEKGQLLLGYYNSGIDLFDINQGVIKKYRSDLPGENYLPYNKIIRINRRNDNKFGFIAPTGYFIYDNIENKFITEKILDGVWLSDVYFDNNGNYWIGTMEKGLWIIWADGRIEKHDLTNGFPSNTVCGILEDNQGNMWISSYGGLSKYYLTKSSFQHYTISDGLQGKQFTLYARLKASDGTLYFGGYNGFNIIYPDSIKTNTYIPPLYIDKFHIFNKPVKINAPNSPLKKCITETKELVLSHKHSVFSFGFTAVNFTSPEKANYAYMMEGFDKSWNYSDANIRYATYTNLDPGEYIFKVKATNNDGIWNENPRTIKITITPPFWNKMWIRIIFIISISSLILLWYLVKSRKKVASNYNQIFEGIKGNEKPKSTDEIFLQNVINIIEQNLEDENFSVEKLSSIVSMNRTQLYRKIHAITNQNVGDFIFSIRLVCAAKLMLNTSLTISEIAYRVGFKDNAHFTRRFKQYFKMTPSSFIKKFRKQNN